MGFREDIQQLTQFLTQNLSGYEVIPANWGWHIHKGNRYCGLLQYQRSKGWQGNAFKYLPAQVREQLATITL